MSTPSTASLRPIVICGPSGAGKSTILKRLFAEFPTKFGFSISNTTRAPRGQEQNGVEYHFVTRDAFEDMIAKEEFVEYAQFGGNYYGTSKKAIADVAEGGGKGVGEGQGESEGDGDENGNGKGRICVLDIEMEGVKQIQKSDLDARCLFLAPPSLQVLEERLRGRKTDKEEDIRKRLDKARVEIEFSKEEGRFEKVVVNDDLEKAYLEVKEWVEDGGRFGDRS